MLARFDDADERLVVAVDPEVCRPEVAAKTLQGPDNPAGFEIQGSQFALSGDGGAADVDDWLNGFIDLLLL